jgi:hypothetical protein
MGARRSLAKTHDAGWSMLPNMLSYKSIGTGGVTRVIPRSSQTCSVRGAFPQPEKGWVRLVEIAGVERYSYSPLPTVVASAGELEPSPQLRGR